MARVPLNKFSARLPALPITPSELGDIYRAVQEFPITGNPTLDFRLLVVTGMLESGFQSPTIMPPNGESSALGYFQIIRSVRNNIAKRLGIPWDNSMLTQARFAAYGYQELARMLRKKKIPSFRFLPDPLANHLANIRFRYVVGTGSKYFGHRDAKSFMKKLMKNYNFLANGDHISRVTFMHPKLATEFKQLPSTVQETFFAIVRSIPDGKVFVSSVKSSYSGKPRTKQNGPNHADFKAIDFVITPFSTPFFKDQEGKVRSPQFHWNRYLIDHLVELFKAGKVTASVLVEPDHIHIDSNHKPAILTKQGDKSIYPNLDSCGHSHDTFIEEVIS